MESLTIDLFEPGMTALHRAGLGGLACTLSWIGQAVDPGERPPGSWEYDDRSVILRWEGGPAGAGPFFESLYQLAFRIDSGLIDLPGSYWPVEPRPEVKAELQRGMSLTILQFGPNLKAASKTKRVVTYDDGEGHPITIQHQDLIGYTHRTAWTKLVTPGGELRKSVKIVSTIAPGFMKRHDAHGSTEFEQPPGPVIVLHFALVGTLSLEMNRGAGVMIVPDVQDLRSFVPRRQFLNPKDARGCQINGAADAALQAQIRLRAAESGQSLRLDRCQAVVFASAAWSSQQKTRASVLEVDADARELDLFDAAMRIDELKPRIAFAKPERKGEPPRPFWSRGVVRPLIAENLARHQPWYQDFRRLIVSADGRTDEERVRLLSFETKGLQAMIEKTPWRDRGEETLVKSVHEAMRGRFAAIGEETDDPVTYGNRVDRQRQRWRLKFAGAKTSGELRKALADLWSRSDFNPSLRDAWRDLLPWFCDEDRWQIARDLCLLAMASYKRAESPEKVDRNISAQA